MNDEKNSCKATTQVASQLGMSKKHARHWRYEEIKSAQKTIRNAVILRLSVIALLALGLAGAYSDEQENMIRLYNGLYNENIRLYFIIPGFVIDMVLTLVWLYRPKWHTVHLVLYVLLGGCLYLVYVFDVLNLYGIGEVAGLFIAPWIWLVGLIPFIVCGIGRRSLHNS